MLRDLICESGSCNAALGSARDPVVAHGLAPLRCEEGALAPGNTPGAPRPVLETTASQHGDSVSSGAAGLPAAAAEMYASADAGIARGDSTT